MTELKAYKKDGSDVKIKPAFDRASASPNVCAALRVCVCIFSHVQVTMLVRPSVGPSAITSRF